MFATTLDLMPHQAIALPDIEGTALAVTRGTLWITQEDDTRDVVLGAGDLWMVERDGLTIIEAQNDASFRAVGHAFEREWNAAHAQSWWRRFLGDTQRSPRHVPYY